jgi:cell division protein ZapB
MNFLIYSGAMEADLKSLEEKISKLISLCGQLREENGQLRDNLMLAQQKTVALKSNMLLASNKLEALLQSLPEAEDAP